MPPWRCSRSSGWNALLARLVHAVFGIPGTLLFADVDDLADVIGVVSADVREDLGGLFQLGVIGGLHPLLGGFPDVVELVPGFVPALGRQICEGLVVVSPEGRPLFSFEA